MQQPTSSDKHRATLLQLAEILAAERGAIENGDAAQVVALATSKSEALSVLAGLLAEVRNGNMSAHDRLTLRSLVERCYEANRVNAVAVNTRLAHGQSRLQPLRSDTSTYSSPRRNGGAAYYNRLSARV